MFPLVKFFFIASFLIVISKVVTATSSKDYVNSKLKETKDLLTQIYSQHVSLSAKDANYKGNWVRLWSEAPRTRKQPRAISISDQMFITDGIQVFSIDSNHIAVNNVSKFNLASSQDSVKFIKRFSWNDSIFLILCQPNTCTHYQGTDILNLGKRQIIEYDDLLPVDACFFIRGDHLYLIISYCMNTRTKSKVVPSKIYQWTGMHMRFMQEILTPATRAISTFDDDQSTILLFALENNLIGEVGENFGIVVYEFKDKSDAELITFLPGMSSVTSIHPYYYHGEEYALLTSDENSSGIYWWDGTDLRKWIDVPNVKASSLINIVDVNNETLLFVCNSDVLHIYRIVNHECIHLNDLSLNSGQQVVEIAVWDNENSIMLVLIKLNPDGTYQIELWQLTFYEEQSGTVIKSDEIWNCFDELKYLLDFRMPIIKNLTNSWSQFLPASKNITIATPLQFSNLFIDRGNISLLEFDNKDKVNVSNPLDIKTNLLDYEKIIDIVITSSKNIVSNNKISLLSGNIVVKGDVHVEELYIDKLNVQYLNNYEINMEKFLISESNQSFSVPLQAKTIFLNNLEVSSLCGLNRDHWLQVNDVHRTRLDDIINRSLVYNDTISIDREVVLNELNAKNINGVNIKNFLEDIFVIGKNQVIKGNIMYNGIVQVMKLTTNEINNVSSSKLISKYTNQTLGDVYIETLGVHHLYVEKINGVPVNKAAKMSEENVIKGKVTIGNFIITQELIVKENVTLPFTHSTQVYDKILINGNVFVINLEIEADASLTIGKDILKEHNIHDIIEDSWSKSNNQTVANPTVFERGASIDELSCQYLNGFSENDYLYVNTHEINDLENVTFTNFHFDKVINDSSGIVENFFEESSNLFTFHKAIRMSHLSVDNIITDSYNGISMEYLMQANDSLKFSGISEFEAVSVKNRMIADYLQMNRLNLRNSSFKIALMSGQDLQIDVLKVNNINMRNLQVKNLCENNLEEGLLNQMNFENQLNNLSLTVDGEMEIESSLQVDQINAKETSDYIDIFKNVNLIDLIETRNIKNLHIMENLNVTLLNEHDINDILNVALSKSSKQLLSGEFEFFDTTIRYLKTEIINNKNVSSLMYTDEPCVFPTSTSFSELLVQGNVLTKTLKDKYISKIQEELQVVPISSGISLHVFGTVLWDEPLLNLHSIDYLLNNAITKHENQFINCSVTFQDPVIIDSLYLKKENSLVFQKINEIVSDALTDSRTIDSVFVKGTKIFKKGLVISDLEVINNIDINNINELDIDEVTSRIFQKYNNDTISAQITFLGEVEIGKLITTKKIHGVPLYELATYNKKMPKYLHFSHLIVQGNVTLYKLDGVDFDDFKKKRVTTHEDHEIFGDVQFNDYITVLNESFVSLINGIRPTNLVLNDPAGIPIVIYDKKIFTSNIVVEQDIEVDTINNLNAREMYQKSIFNNENVTIFGNLIFEDDIETTGNVYVSGYLNRLKPEQVVEVQLLQKKLAAKVLSEQEFLIENSVLKSVNSSSLFAKQLLYLERDKELNIQLPGVHSVRSMPIESTTRLDIYATEAATFCGLERDCFCRRQYVVEISSSGNYTTRRENSSDVTFNFYEPNGSFGLKVVSEMVSSSENCSLELTKAESTRISWMKFGDHEETGINELTLKVNGFVADAQVFMINDRLYLILAIFYDKTINSHATDSFVYEFNLQNKRANNVQPIATDGAKALHVFRIIDVGVYVIIGCVKGKAESLLFRFNQNTRMFQLVRSFATGGSKHIASVSRNNKSFVILNNPDIEALQIYTYDSSFDNFNEYQNLYFESRVTSLNVFYAGEFGNSEAFVVTTTKDGWFYIYEYMIFGKFQLKISHWEEDVQALSPFRHMNQNYLFAGLKLNSTVFKIIQQGLN